MKISTHVYCQENLALLELLRTSLCLQSLSLT